MKRAALLVFGLGPVALACNAILGNETGLRYEPRDGGGDACLGCASGGNGSGPDASSSGGRSNASGGAASSTGGRSTSSGGTPSSGGTTTSSGGAASTGGSTGGPCVPRGAEDCLNGLDDDCNGKTDCEDTTCTNVQCIALPTNSLPGTFLAAGDACPGGYSPMDVKRGLTADYGCAGCTCTPITSRCESSLYGHETYGCPSYQGGQSDNVYNTSCETLRISDNSFHYFDVTGFTECAGGGTGTPKPSSWGEQRTFCVADRVGAGCATGSVCAPKLTTPCRISPGTASCGGNFPDDTGGAWYTGSTDTRACSQCTCAFGGADCLNAYIAVYSQGNCQGNPVQLGQGTQGDTCNIPFKPVSAKVMGVPSGGSCQENTPITGELTATGEQTICCQ